MTDSLTRPTSPALDELLGQRFPVLDDGFVRVVDYMGNDASVVQAARVSYGAGTKTPSSDRDLIRYLMRHGHTTPFEMCELKLHVRVPMDTWRQWIRHRTASVNEYSTRYSVAIDAMQATAPDGWRAQSTGNRQGSDDYLPERDEIGSGVSGELLSADERMTQGIARETYNRRIESGVAREQARKDLPLSTYTEAYWKCNLHNLLHFLELRMHETAQQEIRQYAEVIGAILAEWVPLTWDAFLDYRVGAMTLSLQDVDAIATGDVQTMSKRERRDLAAKLERLGLPALEGAAA